MRVHVIYAHPLADSLSAQLHQLVLTELRAAGHEVDDLDLYAEGFDPVLSAEDRAGYHAIPNNRAKVESYLQRLQSAEAVVLCHPVWNFGWPAILQGYFDRIFLPGVSFKMQAGKLSPGLGNIKKLVTVTTYGSKRWRAMVLGDPPRKNGTRFLRAVCSPRVKVQYHALYGINTITPQRIEAFKQQVARAMAQI